VFFGIFSNISELSMENVGKFQKYLFQKIPKSMDREEPIIRFRIKTTVGKSNRFTVNNFNRLEKVVLFIGLFERV